MTRHALLQLLIFMGLGVQIVPTASDDQCAQPECRINPNTPCEVITHKYETKACPSSLHPKLPPGGFRDLPGTPTDLKVERKEDTGEPIIDITWKPSNRDADIPEIANFTLFIEVWDVNDSFKRKCHDRWYTIKTDQGSTWPEQKSITVRLSCHFFFDKWLFIFVNSEFSGASPCFVRQARVKYKSSEAPLGLPDYRIRMDPSGKDDILISFEPDPSVEHVILWCDQGQSPKCKRTPENECQRTTLQERFSSKVFKNIKPCHNYTLQICPQGQDSITQMFQVFIPDLIFSSFQNPADNNPIRLSDITNGMKSSSLQPTTTQPESDTSSYIIWIVVGSIIISSLIVSFILYRKFTSVYNRFLTTDVYLKYINVYCCTREIILRSLNTKITCYSVVSKTFIQLSQNNIRYSEGGSITCPCKEMKRKFLLHFETLSASNTFDTSMGRNIEEETCVLRAADTPTVPIFYYPDNNSHVDKINWWVARIQKKSQTSFSVKVVSVIDESFQNILSNDDLDMFGVLFIINSKGLHQFLPCLKFKNKSSPKKQTVVRYLKERHNKVFILELYDEEKSEISDIQTLLDLDNVIQLNDGKADESIKHILNLLKDQDLGNQTFSKTLENQASLDGGYYSGDKFPQPVKTFFPPELVSADSEGSINDRLAAINQRCSKHYGEGDDYEVDYLGATFTVHQAADSLSV